GGWTLNEALAVQEKGQLKKVGKDGKPSEVNHGNVTPTITEGGVTFKKAIQTTVLSLPALRRLRFPLLQKSAQEQAAVNLAARTALAGLGLAAAALARDQGAHLRSRCQLYPSGPFVWELLDQPGAEPRKFSLTGAEAVALLKEAIQAAR